VIDLFLIFAFGFIVGSGVGFVAGWYHAEENQIEKFRKELENK
jgi:hypothetical protein